MLFDQLQRFSQLKHSSKFMLAGVAAGTLTDQMTDLTVAVFKFNHIAFATLYNSHAGGTIQADVADSPVLKAHQSGSRGGTGNLRAVPQNRKPCLYNPSRRIDVQQCHGRYRCPAAEHV